ncbi:tRNA pseudouridine(38-40) synthase TruA [Silvibacterium dinghuense]|uniref:tRNA pseudouridine synthase A n=1 Tax=Silvibacterium dinghuense TaxID=1560006 RepID=A0A4Q1SCW7_9BACT|nr:tRNA pseudouridine(38-40) synthase TruA [Silvibacterium dinghuense]RXS95062.1 tRNA pseudouridine(38-40) synthase TruA [Silvibacterium dinghuense]GGH10280.1 tRNA pseudouridine synthase A [Silvibacterium dinghuense]
MNWKLTLAYDGTDFHGWQVQPEKPTIQGHLAEAIRRVTGAVVLPQGSGRTDAGVHALGQVASCELPGNIPPASLQRALNRSLPSPIRILSAEPAAPDFHARHAVIAKTYEYRLFRGELCPPWLARYVYALNWPLDLAAMQAAAPQVEGEHDFTSFAANDPDLTARRAAIHEEEGGPGNVRRIFRSEFLFREDPSGAVLVYRVRGTGFLHHMVRNLVGTFLDIGRGHIAPEAIPAILAARTRTAAGATAPARGLFLESVEYNPER